MPPRKNSANRFWLISIGLHVVVLCVVFLTPARTIFLPPEEPPDEPKITMRDDRLEQAIESIRLSEAKLLARRIALLEAGDERMQTNFETFRTRFASFDTAQKKSAEAEIQDLLATIIPEMERSADAMATGVEQEDFETAMTVPEDSLAKIQDLQERLRRAILLLGLPEQLLQAQAPMEEAQFAIQKHWRDSIAQHKASPRFAEKSTDQASLAEEHLERKREIQAELDQSLTQKRAAEDKLSVAEKRLETLSTSDDAEKRELLDAKKEIDALKRDIRNAENRIPRFEKNVERLAERQEQHLERSRTYADDAKRRLISRIEEMKKALDLQREAIEAQKQIIENIETALAEKHAAVETPRLSDPVTMQAGLFPLPMGWVRSLVTFAQADVAFEAVAKEPLGLRDDEVPSITALYDNAVAHTQSVTEHYRRIKAFQLARIRDLPFVEAYENIESAMPQLAPIDRKLLNSDLRDPKLIPQHKRKVEEVKQSVEMMIELVKRLLLEIETIEDEMAADQVQQQVSIEELLMREDFDPDAEIAAEEPAETREMRNEAIQELEELAKEDEEQRAKDISAKMKEIVNAQDLTRTEIAGETTILPPNLSELPTEENSQLGRSLEPDGTPMKWLVVDSWYTIGPFPNPSRLNLNRKFPPETVVDLNATYNGKDGREISWEWKQSRQPMFVPDNSEEYGIWYAFTEIHMDEPRDLWVAVGSDDKSNIWLNDLPIWISGDKLKGWRINEGFRKVHFQEGVNRVLYRIENGWRHLGFSFVILAEE
jgi:hypothetical protein